MYSFTIYKNYKLAFLTENIWTEELVLILKFLHVVHLNKNCKSYAFSTRNLQKQEECSEFAIKAIDYLQSERSRKFVASGSLVSSPDIQSASFR